MFTSSQGAKVMTLGHRPASALDEFEQIYVSNIDVLMGYFARRCAEPQTVADLTSETFVRAAAGFAGFDRRKGSARAWLFGIATRVYAQHCEQFANNQGAVARLAGRRPLDVDEIQELAAKIDAERDGAALIQRCARLPELERPRRAPAGEHGLACSPAAPSPWRRSAPRWRSS